MPCAALRRCRRRLRGTASATAVAPHMSSKVAGSSTTPRPTASPLNRPSSASWRQRRRAVRRRVGDVAAASSSNSGAPAAAGQADDLVVRALAADVLVGRDRGQDRDADRLGEGLRLAGAVVLVDDHAGDADIAAELAEILDRRADIVGDVERLQVVRADDDDLLAHVAGDRQAEAAADHVAQEVEQHVVEAPFVEAELLQQLEAVDDAAPAAAAADFRAAELHGEDAVALEADVADLRPARRRASSCDEVSMMVGQARPPNSSEVVSLFGSQPISSTFLPCCAIM